jgi:phosphatidylglycerophosphate synthase
MMHKIPENKPFHPLEEIIFFRPLSRLLAKILAKTTIHPNLISIFGFVATIVVCIIIILIYPLNKLSSNVITAVALYIAYLFDKVDGDLARYKKLSSLRGAYLDSFLDRVEEIALLVAIVESTRFSKGWLIVSAMAGILIFYAHMYMFWYYSKGELSFFPTNSLKKRHIKNLLAYNRSKHFLLLIALTLIGHLEYSFYIFSLLIPYTILLFFILIIHDKRFQG